MKVRLKSKILANGLAAAVAFGAFLPSAFAVKTPLHEVLRNVDCVSRLDDITRMVSDHPEWVNEKDNCHNFPLHLAAR